MSRVLLLGVPIDPMTGEEAVRRIRAFLEEPRQCHVMTPNAEMLVEARRNPAFHALLRRTALNLPDSVGLLYAARWTGQHLPERVTGVDTVTKLLAALDAKHPVFLLGAAPGIAEKAAAELRRHNPQLVIAGTHAGSPSPADAPAILERIRAAKPHLLLVAYGAPRQDLWIDAHRAQMPSVRVAMGVGGTLDFLAGTQKRAPRVFQKLGLEWLWRLVKEPRRWKRILIATLVFPWMMLRHRRHATAPRAPHTTDRDRA